MYLGIHCPDCPGARCLPACTGDGGLGIGDQGGGSLFNAVSWDATVLSFWVPGFLVAVPRGLLGCLILCQKRVAKRAVIRRKFLLRLEAVKRCVVLARGRSHSMKEKVTGSRQGKMDKMVNKFVLGRLG